MRGGPHHAASSNLSAACLTCKQAWFDAHAPRVWMHNSSSCASDTAATTSAHHDTNDLSRAVFHDGTPLRRLRHGASPGIAAHRHNGVAEQVGDGGRGRIDVMSPAVALPVPGHDGERCHASCSTTRQKLGSRQNTLLQRDSAECSALSGRRVHDRLDEAASIIWATRCPLLCSKCQVLSWL